MQKTRKMKKTFRFILPILAAGAIVAASTDTGVQVNAAQETLPVYDVTVGETGIINTLKMDAINEWCTNNGVNPEDINFDYSTADITGLDYTKVGIQPVTLKVNLVYNDNRVNSVGYSFTQEAAVNMQAASAPQLKLKSSEVTVNNGDTFNAESYISYVKGSSNELPALTIDTQNLDMGVDGQYVVTYKAIDLVGATTTQSLVVNVQTPQEVLDAIAAAEAEAQRIAEEEAKAEAERLAAEQAASLGFSTASGSYLGLNYSGGSNPYAGGWSNCTYGAWQALYNATGIALPNLGNASEWYSNAAAYGYAVSGTPTAGGIAVYNGHVAYVSGVNADGSVNIVEGGFSGHYNERTVSASGTGTKSIIGYINL